MHSSAERFLTWLDRSSSVSGGLGRSGRCHSVSLCMSKVRLSKSRLNDYSSICPLSTTWSLHLACNKKASAKIMYKSIPAVELTDAYMNNNLSLARKPERIFVCGHYLLEKRTVFWKRSSRKTEIFEEQGMMPKYKYRSTVLKPNRGYCVSYPWNILVPSLQICAQTIKRNLIRLMFRTYAIILKTFFSVQFNYLFDITPEQVSVTSKLWKLWDRLVASRDVLRPIAREKEYEKERKTKKTDGISSIKHFSLTNR